MDGSSDPDSKPIRPARRDLHSDKIEAAMTAHLWSVLGTNYGDGLLQILVASVLGAAILYAKHGIGTFGLCVLASIAGYAGSWHMLSLWGGQPSLVTCELLGGCFGLSTAHVWLKLREFRADERPVAGDVARPVLGK
jgi:hypothetical protein